MPRPLTISAANSPATTRIQMALDRAKDGPLHLILGPGDHYCGGLRIHSGTVFELANGAALRFLPDYDAYSGTEVSVVAEESNRAMLVAFDAQDITLCGSGRIVCDGAAKFSRGDDAEMGTRLPDKLRPRVLVFDNCRNISLRDLTVQDSPMWTLHFVACTDLNASNLKIDNDRRMPNTDGIVIDSCTGVQIRNCEIRTADDGIVLKTSTRTDGAPQQVCSDVTVTDCVIESRSCALKIGTESYGDFTDLTFSSCTLEACNRGLGIFSRDGGRVRNVVFQDIALECHETPDGFWGSGEPLTISVLTRRPTCPAGSVSDVTVANIQGTAPGAINLWAETQGAVRNVALSNITLQQTPGPLGTSGAYDLRPTPADLNPSDDANGRANAWRRGTDGRVIGLVDYPKGRPALFAHNVTDLQTYEVVFNRPNPLPDGWNSDAVTLTNPTFPK